MSIRVDYVDVSNIDVPKIVKREFYAVIPVLPVKDDIIEGLVSDDGPGVYAVINRRWVYDEGTTVLQHIDVFMVTLAEWTKRKRVTSC